MKIIKKIIDLLPDWLLLLIRKFRIVREIDYPNIYIYVDNKIEHNSRLRTVERDPLLLPWVEKFSSTDIAYDIGANVGTYSMIMSYYSRRWVVSFEPAPLNYAKAHQNIMLNNIQNIQLFPYALSDITGVNTFNIYSMTVGDSSHSLGNTKYKPHGKTYTITYRLDYLIDNFNFPIPDHVKIDVDGREHDALMGLGKYINAVKSIHIEMNDGSSQRYLKDRGFVCVERCGVNQIWRKK